MTIKRLLLIGLTLLAILLSGLSLVASWQKPQFQSRLELYQTNILLQGQAWQPETTSEGNLPAITSLILGDKPLESARKQYQEADESVQSNLEKAQKQLAKLHQSEVPQLIPRAETVATEKQLQQSVNQLQKWRDELNLRLGILQARTGSGDLAATTWQKLLRQSRVDSAGRSLDFPGSPELGDTAQVLIGMSNQQLLPHGEQLIQQNLSGWFRSTALIQLYQLQQREDALSRVQAAQQAAATEAVLKLAIIATIPTLAAAIGVLLLIFLIGQRLVLGNDALLAQNATESWSTPWTGETILQVFVLGFFLMGQLFVPELLAILPIPRGSGNARIEAGSVLVSYLLVAAGALLVLYFSIRRFLPLSSGWFQFKWTGSSLFWGLGGYCTALPIVVVVSLINQQIWQGQGGSNPLLEMALASQDLVALAIFFLTAAICAPFFEEFLFRGFLLASLTRYLPVWAAILVSSLLFALAHLSLSEVLPLTALGMVLGLVYTRERNLLAPMLIHSLWNSGTLMSLFLLGSGNQ
jgi:membrane protease YdiL (CAAX protease family)